MLALVLLLGPGLLQYWGEMVKSWVDMFIYCVMLMADGCTSLAWQDALGNDN